MTSLPLTFAMSITDCSRADGSAANAGDQTTRLSSVVVISRERQLRQLSHRLGRSTVHVGGAVTQEQVARQR